MPRYMLVWKHPLKLEKIMTLSSRFLASAFVLTAALALAGCFTTKDDGWVSLFDGKKLGNWAETDFSGKGEVRVDENGSLVLDMGIELTGVTQ